MGAVRQLPNTVARFIDAAARSGYEQVEIFIDAERKTEETWDKWRSRRIEEVMKERRNMPLSVNILLGDAFKANKVKVHYSSEADNDDTLASYAHAHGADVLSRDAGRIPRDFQFDDRFSVRPYT